MNFQKLQKGCLGHSCPILVLSALHVLQCWHMSFWAQALSDPASELAVKIHLPATDSRSATEGHARIFEGEWEGKSRDSGVRSKG